MNTFDENPDKDREWDEERIRQWVLQRKKELNLSNFAEEIDKETCSCEEPQSATEFFLLGPRDHGCECDTC